MDHALSTRVSAFLDDIAKDFPEITISPKDAEALFAGDHEVKVKDLTQHQLLQVAICQLLNLVIELDHTIGEQKQIIRNFSKSRNRRK